MFTVQKGVKSGMGNLKRRGSRKRGAKVRISKMKEETDDEDLIYEGIATFVWRYVIA